MPSFVEPLERSVLSFQPLAETLNAARAIAEHRFRLVADSCPVECSRLAPQIPAIKGRTARHMPGDFLKEVQNRLTHPAVIEAISRRSLGSDWLSVLGGIAAIGILHANPLRS